MHGMKRKGVLAGMRTSLCSRLSREWSVGCASAPSGEENPHKRILRSTKETPKRPHSAQHRSKQAARRTELHMVEFFLQLMRLWVHDVAQQQHGRRRLRGRAPRHNEMIDQASRTTCQKRAWACAVSELLLLVTNTVRLRRLLERHSATAFRKKSRAATEKKEKRKENRREDARCQSPHVTTRVTIQVYG